MHCEEAREFRVGYERVYTAGREEGNFICITSSI